jgi:hypothetical protein
MEEYLDIDLLHFNKHKFNVFIEACKKNNISPRDAIDTFIDSYIIEAFGVNANSINMDIKETIEEY